MIDTQGDGTGGVIIAWVIIGGANGFLVNPAQFSYVDGSFTDPGKVQAAQPQRAPGADRAPSTSSASTTAICPPTRARATGAGSTRRAPR